MEVSGYDLGGNCGILVDVILPSPSSVNDASPSSSPLVKMHIGENDEEDNPKISGKQKEEEEERKAKQQQQANSNPLPYIIAIIDTSSSMGNLVTAVLNGAIPNALIAQGYPKNALVDVITFASNSTYFPHQTVRILQNSCLHGGGETYMAGIFPILKSRFLSLQGKGENNIHIICVSDGLLMDGRETLKAANDLKASTLFAANIEVTMIRLKTSEVGEPDTRALACLGQFATSNEQPAICDIETRGISHNSLVDRLQAVFIEHMRAPREGKKSVTVISSTNSLRRSPQDVRTNQLVFVPTPMLDDPNGRSHFFFLLPPHATQQKLLIDNSSFSIVIKPKMNLSLLEQFCNYCMTQLRLQIVIGNDLAVMQHFFTQLDSFFASQEMNTIATEEIDNYHGHNNDGKRFETIRNRIRSINCTYKKKIREQILAVLQLANQDKLLHLNMTQQQAADYLRTSTSTSLAKRTMKHQTQQLERGEKDSIKAQAVNILQIFEKEQEACKETNVEDKSFYSLYNNEETYLELLSSLNDNEVEDEIKNNLPQQHQEERKSRFITVVGKMQDMDILRLIGLLGICYNHQIGDVIDPYTFHIKKFFGASAYLSLADLRDANLKRLNEENANLYAPGTTTTITGVLPLRFLNPHLFDILWFNGMKLLEMHSSINMRRMMAPVRSDSLGERIGLLFCIMRKNANLQSPISNYDEKVFEDVFTQLKMLLQFPMNKEEFAPIFEIFEQQKCIRDQLTGANCISCIQKPMIALLQIAPTLPLNYIVDVLHIFFEFDAYHKARHYFSSAKERHEFIHKLFQIDENSMVEAFPLNQFPDIPMVSSNGVHRHIVLEEKLQAMVREHIVSVPTFENLHDSYVQMQTNWMPKSNHYIGYYRFLTRNHPEQKQQQISFQICRRKWCLALVSATMCAEEQDRIVENKSITFDWNNEESENAFITNIVQKYYLDFYRKQANIELTRRDNVVLNTQIHLMVKLDTDLDMFIESLNEYIPNRDHSGYPILLHDLLSSLSVRKENSSLDSAKLYVLITGRDFREHKKEDDAKIVYCSGNVDVNIRSFRDKFTKPVWDTIEAILKNSSLYRYRASDKPNSHGHCNSNPSMWALNWQPFGKK